MLLIIQMQVLEFKMYSSAHMRNYPGIFRNFQWIIEGHLFPEIRQDGVYSKDIHLYFVVIDFSWDPPVIIYTNILNVRYTVISRNLLPV